MSQIIRPPEMGPSDVCSPSSSSLQFKLTSPFHRSTKHYWLGQTFRECWGLLWWLRLFWSPVVQTLHLSALTSDHMTRLVSGLSPPLPPPARILEYKEWQKPVCLGSGTSLEENKGLLPVLYSKVFELPMCCNQKLSIIIFGSVSNVITFSEKVALFTTRKQCKAMSAPVKHHHFNELWWKVNLYVNFSIWYHDEWKSIEVIFI